MMEKITTSGHQPEAGASAMDYEIRNEAKEATDVSYNNDESFVDEFAAVTSKYGAAMFKKCMAEIQRVEEEVEEVHDLNDVLMAEYRKLMMHCVDVFDPELGSLMAELKAMQEAAEEGSEEESESDNEESTKGESTKEGSGQD